MTTDVVGGVQTLAERWAQADEDVRTAARHLSEAEDVERMARARQEEAAIRLMERVGRNIRVKVFHVGEDAIIVEHEHGIRRVSIEREMK